MGVILGIESTAHTFSIGGVLQDGKTISSSSALFRPEKGGIHPREAADHHSVISGEKFREFISHNDLDTKE
ncbi:MAG: UGMP family protein, partial [Euryarchaeota archaeon]|nr:UGMP family protein [Euryarchaeota archaeon]